MELLTEYALIAARWMLPILGLWLIFRCVRSMLSEKYEAETWAHLETAHGEMIPVSHWESIIGRSRSCDITLDSAGVSRTHAALIRDDKGQWKLYDLESKSGTAVGALRDEGKGLKVRDGDCLFFADTQLTFHDMDARQLARQGYERSVPGTFISPGISLLILTVFQALLALQFTAVFGGKELLNVTLGFAAVIMIEWCYYFLMRAIDRTGFEVETISFFLTTLGIEVCATSTPNDMMKQILLLIAGIVLFVFLGWWLRDLRRTKAVRWLVALGALGFMALNLLAGRSEYGAMNWLSIGGFSLQPSEFVKVAYIFVGGASLDRLFRRRNLFMFIAFSAVCVGALALMGDFGTALIFFATFLVISFMRSGSFATVFLAVAGAALAGFLVLTVKPYIAQRFAAWGHIWSDPYGAGWQQTRGLSAAASGGLVGIGAGKGWLHSIFAADTDMVFCLISEELGLILALLAMLALIAISLFSVRTASRGRSSYYVITSCAASSMMLVQLALNVFGSTDLLPFTGVTFPFVSKGGSSLISCWAMLAFIKSADNRQNASFSVRLSSREKYCEDEEEEE